MYTQLPQLSWIRVCREFITAPFRFKLLPYINYFITSASALRINIAHSLVFGFLQGAHIILFLVQSVEYGILCC